MGEYDELEHGTLRTFKEVHPVVPHDNTIRLRDRVVIKRVVETGEGTAWDTKWWTVVDFMGDFAALKDVDGNMIAWRRGGLEKA